jgi:cytoskeleton protein RodZ
MERSPDDPQRRSAPFGSETRIPGAGGVERHPWNQRGGDADVAPRDRRAPRRPDRRSGHYGRRASDVGRVADPSAGANARRLSGTHGTMLENRSPAQPLDVGAVLREARERRDLSLDQLSHATRITAEILRAIEDNRIERLPEGVFLRGFLRAYAHEVGLNAEETVTRYLDQFEPLPHAVERATAGTGQTRVERMAVWGSLEERDQSERRVTRLQWLGIVVVVLGTVTYYAVDRWRGSALPPSPASPSERAGSVSPGPAIAAAATAGTATPTAESPEGTTLAGTESQLHLEIRARGPCWVAATVDGRRAVYRLIEPGEQQAFDIREGAVLRIGDPAAFEFSINGRVGRSLGRAGEAVTVHLTRENYRELLRH